MTLEQLLEVSVDKLEEMTDSELLKHMEPYLKIARPNEPEVLTIVKKRRGRTIDLEKLIREN
tara:strand:- start:1646 stop:1831 length:186 start_codon:yes stop_codon:yes gene_type:complete